jgi:hypothetical protein
VAQAKDAVATSGQVRHVFRFFDRRRGEWSFENSGFALNRRAKVGRRSLILNYKIHANRVARERTAYRASLTIWPVRLAGSKEPLFPVDWRNAVTRRLKRHGYYGRFRIVWRRYYFGDFWKNLPDFKAVATEVSQLEAWAHDPVWLPPASAPASQRKTTKGVVGRRRTRR